MDIDRTHDPDLRSWVASANAADADFPIQNLPFGRFRRAGSDEPLRAGVAIGDQVLDLALAAAAWRWPDGAADWFEPLARGDLNAFMAAGRGASRALRAALSQALSAGAPQQPALQPCLLPQAAAQMALPCEIDDYTDFYTSIHHARAVGRLFRPDNPLLPNYRWVPIGYHGRASSIVVGGTPLRRPLGQIKGAGDDPPRLAPTQRLDYEVELAYFVGRGNALGEPIEIGAAGEHLFGVALLNDWSARDVQPWEYQPLGPFLSKNFASTVSPWIVTMEALAPFRSPLARSADDPAPLPYLHADADAAQGALAVTVEAWLQTAAMRAAGAAALRLSSAGADEAAYWTPAQLVAHHTVGGCNLRPGDLLGSGTLSGPRPEQAGSLIEHTQGGSRPLALPGGEERRFLADGDTLTLRAHCLRPGARRIGFGDCSGTVLPARA